MPVFVCLPGLSGVLEVEISQLHIRRSALIKADPGTVWEEFTTFERISAWLDQGHKLLEFEPWLSGKVRFNWKGCVRGSFRDGQQHCSSGYA